MTTVAVGRVETQPLYCFAATYGHRVGLIWLFCLLKRIRDICLPRLCVSARFRASGGFFIDEYRAAKRGIDDAASPSRRLPRSFSRHPALAAAKNMYHANLPPCSMYYYFCTYSDTLYVDANGGRRRKLHPPVHGKLQSFPFSHRLRCQLLELFKSPLGQIYISPGVVILFCLEIQMRRDCSSQEL